MSTNRRRTRQSSSDSSSDDRDVQQAPQKRILVQSKHLWEDALRGIRLGINFQKYIRITFVGEPADNSTSVRPQLSAEVCASAHNLPLECFQNLVERFYW